MTKTDFKSQAVKAGLNPNLYDVIIPETLHTREGYSISGGHIIGIAWFDEWKTEIEYDPARGKHESTFLSKIPYLVLTKERRTYHIAKHEIDAYLDQKTNDMLSGMTAKAMREKSRKT